MGRPAAGLLQALDALQAAARDVATSGGGAASPSLNALLALETGADDLLSGDPSLSPLRAQLSRLRPLAAAVADQGSDSKKGGGVLGSLGLLRQRRSGEEKELSRVAAAIADELQSWIDRERVERLVNTLQCSDGDDDERVALLLALEDRLAAGFNPGLQQVLLRSGAFAAVESALAGEATAKPVRDRCAAGVLALVRFNKDVFVGPVLMGPTIGALVSAASPASLRALNGLIAAIRSPIVDELLSREQLPKLVAHLASPDIETQKLALDLALEIGYYGRKEAVDAMLAQGLVKRLLCLQRSEQHGGTLIDMKRSDGAVVGTKQWRRRRPRLEARPLASAVARFAIQVEVGEGLRQREKMEVKMEILRAAREAASTPGEAATVAAEVLWGSTP